MYGTSHADSSLVFLVRQIKETPLRALNTLPREGFGFERAKEKKKGRRVETNFSFRGTLITPLGSFQGRELSLALYQYAYTSRPI